MQHSAETDAALTVHFAAPTLAAGSGVRLARAAGDLWRVVDGGGRVVGHLQALVHPLGLRWRARRYHAPTGRFRELGDFWSPDDAVGSLRG